MTRKSETEGRDYLRPEDRILWETVAKTAKPLNAKKLKTEEFPDFDSVMAQEIDKKPSKRAAPTKEAPSAKKKPAAPQKLPIQPLDKPTHRKISKGRVDIEARIDLHGLTQSDAYELLYSFLLSAHGRGLRHVMVITGKGRSYGSEGLLKQVVPHWFSTPLFRLLVSAYEDAAHHHGGHGALYVRLRKQTQNGGMLR